MSNAAALLSPTARTAVPRWLPLVAVFVLAAGVRGALVIHPDVSWGLTMAEKLLDGQRLYVDIGEVNPPATTYLYVAPVWLARVIGLRAEFIVEALVFVAAALSLWLAGRILLRASLLEGRDGWLLATIAAAALTILPGTQFGEREHIGLIVFLPYLAMGAARAMGRRPDFPMAIVAGLGAGLAVVLKPHLASALICTAAAVALSVRSWRLLFTIENWIAGLVAAGYGAWVILAFPQFVSDTLPLVLTVYVPVKASFGSLALNFATRLWIAALALIVWLKRRAVLEPPFCLLLATSFGFAISFYVQQKGWAYQSYPMLALAAIGLAIAFIDRWHGGPTGTVGRTDNRWAALTCATIAGLIWGGTFCWMNAVIDHSGLAAAVRALKPHPKILEISEDLAVGHPLTRQVQGIWVGREPSLWISAGVLLREKYETLDAQTTARLDAYAARDRARLAEDIARQQPDVILVGLPKSFSWLTWANSDPMLAKQLEHYREYRTVEDVLILRREDSP
jgi:hypothetical protein